jgi:hypothetical protein
MSTTAPSTGPVAEERLLELTRARSLLTVDLVQWRDGKLGVSIGFTPISAQNPRGMTRYVTVTPGELPAVIGALEAARTRIAAIEAEHEAGS